MKSKYKTIRAYADIGSHNGIFIFEAGPVAERYPNLLHIFSKKDGQDLRPVKITYKIN